MKFFLLDCRKMLIDIRLSLVGGENLDLPSDAISETKSPVCKAIRVRKATEAEKKACEMAKRK